MQSKSHWEKVYTTKSSTAVSWYQPHATLSLDLIRQIGAAPAAAIIDVGGVTSMISARGPTPARCRRWPGSVSRRWRNGSSYPDWRCGAGASGIRFAWRRARSRRLATKARGFDDGQQACVTECSSRHGTALGAMEESVATDWREIETKTATSRN